MSIYFYHNVLYLKIVINNNTIVDNKHRSRYSSRSEVHLRKKVRLFVNEVI